MLTQGENCPILNDLNEALSLINIQHRTTLEMFTLLTTNYPPQQ